MRLLVVSDLHVDHRENRPKAMALADHFASQDADALIIAGDVSHRLDQLETTLAQFARFEGPKLFVAGNHDVWVVRPKPSDAQDSATKFRAVIDVARRQGFWPLDSSNAEVGAFTFVGSMGWYDYSYAAPGLAFGPSEYAEKRWQDLTYMDRDYARWGASDAEVTDRFVAGVEERLRSARRPIVFVSHHVPRQDLVLRRGHASWDFFNAYMGSRRLEAVVRAHAVERFVFGHTHRPVTLLDPGRFVINNPLGYPRQALTPRREPFDVS